MVLLTWPSTHSACASETIKCRKGERIGSSELGASGSVMTRVYFVFAGSEAEVSIEFE